MKRILICAGYFYPHLGGMEKIVYELSRRLRVRGYEVYIVTCNTEGVATTEKEDGIHIYRLPAWNALGGTYPIPKPSIAGFRIIWKILRMRVDLVNTQTRFFNTSLLGLIVAEMKRIPLVHTEHGTTHSVTANRYVRTIAKTYDHVIGSLIVRRAKQNIGVSQAACDFVRHLGGKNPAMIPNGIDIERYRKVRTGLRGRLGVDGAIVITYVGRLIYSKGVQDLISVFPELEQKLGNVLLLVVGDGAYRQKLESMAARVKGEGIVFLGEKNPDEIIEILSIADIFVNPSYSEGLPTSVMEAAAVGLPIVATDVGGTREIVDDGKNGFLVAAGDTRALKQRICQLVEDNQLRDDFATNIHDFVEENFDWDEIADRWVREIISVIS